MTLDVVRSSNFNQTKHFIILDFRVAFTFDLLVSTVDVAGTICPPLHWPVRVWLVRRLSRDGLLTFSAGLLTVSYKYGTHAVSVPQC